MKKTIPKLLTLVCLLVAVMGLSVVTAHAATVTGIVSSGNEYRYHEDKTPVSQWGPYTSNKLKYFTRNDTGETVPAYCMEPEVRSASGDLQYSSTSWSDLTWNQRYAVTLAMAYGYGGNYGFNMHPDCAQLATQAVVWEFVCGYRSPVYPYALYDTTCANLFHYAGDDVAVAYNIIIDRIMNHGKIPSFAVKYRNQLSDANAITLTWDGSQYVGTATDTNGVLSQYYFSTNISGVTVNQSWNTLTVTATKDAAAQLNGYISSDYGYSLDVAGTESVLLEPSNGSGYQACAALTSLPDPVWAYIHFKVNIVEEKGSLTINKVDAETGKALAGVTYRLYDSAGKKVADVTTGADGKAVLADLLQGRYSYQEISALSGYVVDSTKYQINITATALNITAKRTNALAKGSLTINKVDAETGKALAGVTYRLYDSTGEKVADATTGADGKAVFGDLPQGKYSYQEISAPSGYVVDNTEYQITITATALNITHKRTNALAKGSITVRKLDATGAPLAGAELLLETSADGETWAEVGRVTTDNIGIAKWENLKIGVQFRITEVKAPAGYTLMTEPLFTGTLDSNNRDITITACNNAGFVLPFTGGTGFTTYFLFAALMLCMGVYFCKKLARRKTAG
ncbi:SpaA isopeptide-forming pilin-related protein [Vescimonas sanitatis]|uniref:SpaA isopeptide-forming pilin-related protein n=1 Tax=Vescimonas sanitatis TaxID=3376993 RepID=UPI003B7D2EB0